MADEITQKHFDRARVRGAPSTIPGSVGMVGTYPVEEVQRQTVRALIVQLDRDFTIPALNEARSKLAQLAAAQELQMLETPLIALKADPVNTLPSEWEWELALPVRGRVKAEPDAGVAAGRIQGGAYVEVVTAKGFPDLRNLYIFCLGRYLPSHKQQLTRPLIYHRVQDGLDTGNPSRLTLAVYIPIQLSLKQPQKLLSREDMG